MQQQQYNIAIISDDANRMRFLSELLQDPRYKEHLLNFESALSEQLPDNPNDAVVVDCVSNPELEYKVLAQFRDQRKLQNTPFIFILLEGHETLKRQIYKNPNNKMVIDPVDKFVFISVLNSALDKAAILRRNLLYQDIIEGEKKLLSHMDDLLELGRIYQLDIENELMEHLEKSFIHRMELALAVETAIFTTYDEHKNTLCLNHFAKEKEELLQKHTLQLQDSLLQGYLFENNSQIIEGTKLQDPLILELEEALGIKIFSLLFIPITVFHQPRAALILVNKLYRDQFTENDLSFSMIAVGKITYHLEKMQLKSFRDEKHVAGVLVSDGDKKLLKDWGLLNHIMNAVHFGTIVFDAQYKILYMNPASYKILNKKKSQRFQQLNELLDEQAYKYLCDLLDTGKFPIVREELQLMDPQIPHFYIGLSIYPFPEREHTQRYILVFSEISRTKRIQAEIVRMDRMASLGQLSSGIAHEIRNPLAGIKAMVQTLEEQLEDDVQKTEYIQRILRQVNRLTKLLKAFFSYAKPTRPDPAPVHVLKIVEEVMPLIDRKLNEKKIKVVQKYEPDLADVFVDANQIQQVFLNLFLNAIDAMPNGGLLEIQARNATQSKPYIDRRITSVGLLSDEFIQIDIRDNGYGISEKVCQKIFDPFYTTKASGTGLGLSIVFQIIKEHGGRIDVQSEEGQGTQFIIYLPAFTKTAESGEGSSETYGDKAREE